MRPYHYLFLLFAIAIVLMYLAGSPWWGYAIAVFMLLNALAGGAMVMEYNMFIPGLHRGKGSKNISLTFDDGPAAFTPAILDVLKTEGVKAAFFTIGKRAVAQPEILKRWDTEGHIIGNHSYNHGFWFDMLPAGKMLAEINATNDAIKGIIGKIPLLFRPPYGVTNPALAKAVKRSGMATIGWSIRSFDTRAKSPDALVGRVVSRIKGGDIILLHDSMEVTAASLTTLIRDARAKGFIFVPLNELLHIKAYA